MLVLIGGTGFLGKHLCEALHRNGVETACISRTPDLAFLAANAPKIRAVDAQSEQANDVLAQAEMVVYAAHASKPGDPATLFQTEIRQNMESLNIYLSMLNEVKLRNFMYISSGGQVYGRHPHNPIGENAETKPVTAYGLGKQLIENFLAYYFREKASRLTILRLANPVGRHQLSGTHGLVAAAVRAALNKTGLSIYGEGANLRDYFDADDFADFLTSAAQSGGFPAGIFNIGSGAGRTERDIIRAVETRLDARIPLEFKAARSFDLAYAVVDPSKAVEELGWAPTTSLEASIDKMANARSLL